MTLDFSSAKKIAEEYLVAQKTLAGGVPYAIVDAKITEANDGWFFPYQSVVFLTTGDFRFSLVGNWPIFVSRDGQYVGPRRP